MCGKNRPHMFPNNVRAILRLHAKCVHDRRKHFQPADKTALHL